VFEPNDEPLWSQIRLNVGAFMQNLFRQGRLPGHDPERGLLREVRQGDHHANDINLGVVNVVVGFAPSSRGVRDHQDPADGWSNRRLRETLMAQFTVNPQRFDPYKNFKFRVKWDGRYVAGVSKVGGLKRTTEW
jgi:hypothetical protein